MHVLAWPMGILHLDGFAGKVEYAQLLNDASEVKFSEEKGSSEAAAASGKQVSSKTLNLRLPMLQPKVTVPVIELYLN